MTRAGEDVNECKDGECVFVNQADYHRFLWMWAGIAALLAAWVSFLGGWPWLAIVTALSVFAFVRWSVGVLREESHHA